MIQEHPLKDYTVRYELRKNNNVLVKSEDITGNVLYGAGIIFGREGKEIIIPDNSCQVSRNHGVLTADTGRLEYMENGTNGSYIRAETKNGVWEKKSKKGKVYKFLESDYDGEYAKFYISFGAHNRKKDSYEWMLRVYAYKEMGE